jgi:hypothetical protein
MRTDTKALRAGITMLFDHNGLTIEVEDNLSHCQFVTIRLDAEQTCKALSRLGLTPCIIEVGGLTKVGKKMEWETFEFEIPSDLEIYSDEGRKILNDLADKACPEGWEISNYFGSRDSFFIKDDKSFARTTIRRWVEVTG